MSTAWAVADGRWEDIFKGFNNVFKMPWTMSYVAMKRRQIDNYNEIPKEKRPPDMMIWWGSPEDIEEWFDKVYDRSPTSNNDELEFVIDEKDIG